MPWATAFDNVYLPLRLEGFSRSAAASRVETALGMVGLEGFGRVLSARALRRHEDAGLDRACDRHREPELLLMDEPFAALDEITRFKLNDDLLSLWQEKRWTVVFVTHSVYESVYLSKRIVVMTQRPGRGRGRHPRSPPPTRARKHSAPHPSTTSIAEPCRRP